MAIELESLTGVDEATRDAWVAETDSQTRESLEAFETGDAPFGEEAVAIYGEDVSVLIETIEELDEAVDE